MRKKCTFSINIVNLTKIFFYKVKLCHAALCFVYQETKGTLFLNFNHILYQIKSRGKRSRSNYHFTRKFLLTFIVVNNQI